MAFAKPQPIKAGDENAAHVKVKPDKGAAGLGKDGKPVEHNRRYATTSLCSVILTSVVNSK